LDIPTIAQNYRRTVTFAGKAERKAHQGSGDDRGRLSPNANIGR
jgi:hypothetical protein